MRTLFILLLLCLNNSFADNHVYLELDCSTPFGDRSVLILKQLPEDDGPWVDEVPFNGVVSFMNELYMGEVKEKTIEMKAYYDIDEVITELKLKEMVIIDRYEGTLASIFFDIDGTINHPLSFSAECKKKPLKEKQF